MAPLSLLISFIGKKIGTILQAIFGWSITALFGRLDGKREIAVTVALVLSLAWPIFVVGCFFPGVASWALAFLPIQDWISRDVLRVVWIGLAVTAPPLVGAIVHGVAPARRGSWPRAMASGYPVAIGFAAAFLVTAVTVPIVKLLTVLRGWTDTHVFIQAKPGAYADVVRALAEAAARAGHVPEVVDAPKRMTVAADLLRRLARSTIQPILADELRLIRAEGLEIYVYPADVLLRGEATDVARVRAMLTRTQVHQAAYLVASAEGKRIQDEIERLDAVITRDIERDDPPGRIFASRLREVFHELVDVKLPPGEWPLLESLLRRVERRFARSRGSNDLVLDEEPDKLDEIARRTNAETDRRSRRHQRSPAAAIRSTAASSTSLG